MKFFLYFSLIVIGWSSAYTQHVDQSGNSHETSPLFNEEKLLEIQLEYSKTNILTNSNDSTYMKSNFSYKTEEGGLKSMDAEIRVRGNYRRLNCYFLPLKLKIKEDVSQGTIFEEDRKLKMVLPCLNSTYANDDVLKEFLAYKIFQILSPYHFKTKLLRIQLEEEKGNKKNDHDLIGFFIQDDDQLAIQNKGKQIKRRIHPQNQDPASSVRNALFQYMIGNTDYSIGYRHNEKLFFMDDKIVPIPYDFDMSGLVNASYAVVSAINNKTLPITKVTDRLYRGFDRDDEILQQIRNEFLNYEQDIYTIMDRHQTYFRYPKEFKECKSYIEDFYKIIKDDKKFENRILKKERTELD